MASLSRDIAEGICFVERHEHLERVHRLGPRPSCGPSRDIAARVLGRIGARRRAGYVVGYVEPHLLDQPYGEWLRAQMDGRGLTQRDLARLADVDHATVSRLSRSIRSPLLSTARKIERALAEAEA